MKTTAALAVLFAAAAQAAITFEQFPTTGITCPNSDASGQLTRIAIFLRNTIERLLGSTSPNRMIASRLPTVKNPAAAVCPSSANSLAITPETAK